jgi:cytochrome c5
MSKLFCSAAPVALILTASLFCSAANAAQRDAGASQPQVSQTQQAPSDPAVQQANGLTRKQVYDQLVQAEKDGSLARLDATLYGP